MTNRIAVSLALPHTDQCLATLHQLGSSIGMAEIRLDLMESFDLPRLITEAPCPLIITCRPLREGGRFTGSEAERLTLLACAMELGCAYVDVEWDSVAALQRRGTHTHVIVSQHWTNTMPPTLWTAYQNLKSHGDIIKLVGMAAQPSDVLPVFELLRRATSPVIGIAMGKAGVLTRLLAPCYSLCLLTYGAVTATTLTAPGQICVYEMIERYQLQCVGPYTEVHLHLCTNAMSADRVIARNVEGTTRQAVHVSWLISATQAAEVIPSLCTYLPRLTLTADPTLVAECNELLDYITRDTTYNIDI
jgi:3-dehydroquinate dehydratase type I